MSHSASPNSDSGPGNSSVTGRRETLTARAKRIIGRALEPSDDPSANSEAKGKFSKKPSSNARREQVLRAQRTHRQRTQGYINELEKEVLRLRDRETELLTENQNLNARICLLEQNGGAGNLQAPSELFSTSDQGILTPASLPPSNGHVPNSTDFVSVDFTDLADLPPTKGCSIQAAEIPPIPFQAPTYQLDSALLEQQNGHASAESQTPIAYTTMSSQQAVDFVLELEKPCLPHIKYRYMQDPAPRFFSPDYNLGASHAFTASANIVNAHWDEHPESRPFEVSQADIEKLFHTSLSLMLGPDVTPIQVWANISRISQTRLIEPYLMRMMTDEFKKYVRCNSFGAVIERGTADSILGYFFPGEAFHDPWNDGLAPPVA